MKIAVEGCPASGGIRTRCGWACFSRGQWLLLLLLLAGGGVETRAAAAGLLVTEIMYHPAGTNALEQWVEVQNRGTTRLSLAGWRVRGAVEFGFPAAAVVEPGQFLVVASDPDTFAQRHPDVRNVVGGWSGELGVGNDTVRVVDASGAEVDSVTYADSGDWAVRRLSAPDLFNKRGWEWEALHDGGGSSLELRQPLLPNEHGHNWGASLVTGGTPGRANSIATTNVAPLVVHVTQEPPVPRSTDPVRISARLIDESPGVTGMVRWRRDGDPVFREEPLRDDGRSGEGVAGDGVYGAVLPPQPGGTVVEYYLTAVDATGQSRVHPAVEESAGRSAWMVYQVDDAADLLVNGMPVVRLVMVRAEYDFLQRDIWGSATQSDVMVNGAWVASDGVWRDGGTVQVIQHCGLRNRGHGTRTAVPHNFHVSFPADRRWKDREGMNLNTRATFSQHLGSAIYRRAGVPAADSRPVQVRVNGANLAKPGQEQFGAYAANEVSNGRLARVQFPDDPDGQLYRGVRDMIPGIDSDAGLQWLGPDYTAYTNAYAKENRSWRNDWSDFLELVDVLNHAPTNGYSASVRRVVEVEQWMRYFAVSTLLGNHENSLQNGAGDDYLLYRGGVDRRFRVLPYDLDAVMGYGVRGTSFEDGIWRMTNVVVLDRFMKEPEFAPVYFRQLVELAEGLFRPEIMDHAVDELLGGYVDAGTRAVMKEFNASQRAQVLSHIPRALTVSNSLPVVNGLPRTTSATASLEGLGDAVRTRAVRVNGQSVEWIAWRAAWRAPELPLHPGVNRFTITTHGSGGEVLERQTSEIWRDTGGTVVAGGTLSGSTSWTAAVGPYRVEGDVVVPSGGTLTVQPGTAVQFAPGAGLRVAAGGRLLAEGTEAAPIWMGGAPGASGRWAGVVVQGGPGSPESRLVHVHLAGNDDIAVHADGGTVWLERLTFGTTDRQYVSLDDASFVVTDCVFPSGTTGFELVHGTGGIKPGGHGVIRHCLFGSPIGYNDVVDFTGGKRRDGAIVHFLDNVFLGATDDHLDLDGTDAWVEGNIFISVHKNGTPDSASAVSGGSDGGRVSAVTVVRNLFFDCDQVATAKQGNVYTLLHNTIVRQTRRGGVDVDGAVVNLADDGTTEGLGFHLEGNVLVDVEKLVRNRTVATVVFTNNVMSLAWDGPGGGNVIADPLLVHRPTVEETRFTTYEAAQVMWSWLALRPGSPARGAGPNGRDLGASVPSGVSLSGEPGEPTAATQATLTVGTLLTAPWLPAAEWPVGSGYTHYRFRLDGGAWSAARPLAEPIVLSGLTPGPHRVEAVGRLDSGLEQDDPRLGAIGPTVSREWLVDPSVVLSSRPKLRLSEIMAAGAGGEPDRIEIENYGTTAVDLAGVGVSDNRDLPFRFVFGPGTVLPAGGRQVVEAGPLTGAGGLQTGFGLKQSGDDVRLTDAASRGGSELDALTFGPQVAGFSLGRMSDGTWQLAEPTWGQANRPVALGDPRAVRLNEWLADAQFVVANDYLELFNTDSRPVALGGWRISDAAGSPARHVLAPLSFIGGRGWLVLEADGRPDRGPNHLSFRLQPETGMILLTDATGTWIDAVTYASLATDVAAGRSPNGSLHVITLAQPTPGAPNPGLAETECVEQTVSVELVALGATWRFNQVDNLDGQAWTAPGFDDGAWPSGPALHGVESSTLPEPGLQTPLNLGRMTYYFRHAFVVPTNLVGFDLQLSLAVDDGAVVSLDGVPLATVGMAAGTVTYATSANRTVGNATLEHFTLPARDLTAGTHVLAAEVHQSGSNSGDVVWGLALTASRVVTNCTAAGEGILQLAEVMATGEAGADFVEVHNPGTVPVELGGIGLTDDLANPGRWEFPAGEVLAPGARRVVWCDPATAASATHSGFGLNRSGGAVHLFRPAAQGRGLLDSVRYGLQVGGHSIGRRPDAPTLWVLGRPTPGADHSPVALGSAAVLRINEFVADPVEGPDWLELYNPGSQPVALGGLSLTDDLSVPGQSPIAPLSFLGTGADAWAVFLADGSPEAGANHVNFALRRAGEALGLFTPGGSVIDAVTFGAQATGVSEGRIPDGTGAFRALPGSATPGGSNFVPLDAPVFNEVLVRTSAPKTPAVEWWNPGPTQVDVSGWVLRRPAGLPGRVVLPQGTLMAPGAFLVWHEPALTAGPEGLQLSPAGDRLVLAQTDRAGRETGERTEIEVRAVPRGVSLGRVVTAVGAEMLPVRWTTFGRDEAATTAGFQQGTGAENADPLVGPLVITEIASRSEPGAEAATQFVEVRNSTADPVVIDVPGRAAGRWSLGGSVEFTFPTGFQWAGGEWVVVVGFAPTDTARVEAFRARYGLAPTVRLVGPWVGRLPELSGVVELWRSDPSAEFTAPLLGERMAYQSGTPWPVVPGPGVSLQRWTTFAVGSDPASWLARIPTPGQGLGDGPVDSDGDGLPDDWERTHFGSLARDGSGDFDGDGLTDRQEFLAGTLPTSAADVLRLDAEVAGESVRLRINGRPGRTYLVQARDEWTGTWENVGSVTAVSDGVVTVVDGGGRRAHRFYRVQLPPR